MDLGQRQLPRSRDERVVERNAGFSHVVDNVLLEGSLEKIVIVLGCGQDVHRFVRKGITRRIQKCDARNAEGRVAPRTALVNLRDRVVVFKVHLPPRFPHLFRFRHSFVSESENGKDESKQTLRNRAMITSEAKLTNRQ